jgi:uncharacterized protein DUF1549/uncharacterized protein DUF1553
MRISRQIIAVFAFVTGVATIQSVGLAGGSSVENSGRPDPASAAREVDRLIEKKLSEKHLEPLPLTNDEQFVRRIYLDVLGRIPTLEEAQAFLTSESPTKRATLIEQLLASPGHVSHQFNFWADILRVKDAEGGISRAFYLNWVKQALAENKPYDQFVRELVTASGSGWQRGNGAVGYYFRDRGMPLDNMANTLRIFTGTRVACAQCHDHPHDRWTRRQLFEMAAFTSNLTTDNTDARFKAIVKMERATTDKPLKDLSQTFRNQFRRDRVIGASDGTIKLPADYQYADAKPRQTIKAHAIFGPTSLPDQDDKPDYRQRFGDWLTAPDNERFTQVISNRLWKRVMGRGLIEPVDDLHDDTVASHPELLTYLTELMRDLHYDMRAYMGILYNTKAYQRITDPEEPAENESNYFRGHLLTRMTAEQVWDSLLALTIPEIDTRKSGLNTSAILYGGRRVLEGKEDMYTLFDKMKDQTPEEHWEFVTNELKVLRDDCEAQAKTEQADPKHTKQIYDFMVRASELSAPAAPSHLLRTFGQSNREFIEAGSTASNVTQFLTMFNGFVQSQLIENPQSELMKHMSSASATDERCNVLFLSILSRSPTAEERGAIGPRSGGELESEQDLAWALLNSQEFIFVE